MGGGWGILSGSTENVRILEYLLLCGLRMGCPQRVHGECEISEYLLPYGFRMGCPQWVHGECEMLEYLLPCGLTHKSP